MTEQHGIDEEGDYDVLAMSCVTVEVTAMTGSDGNCHFPSLQ